LDVEPLDLGGPRLLLARPKRGRSIGTGLPSVARRRKTPPKERALAADEEEVFRPERDASPRRRCCR